MYDIDFVKWMCDLCGWGFHVKWNEPCIAMEGSLWSGPSSNDWKYRFPFLVQESIEHFFGSFHLTNCPRNGYTLTYYKGSNTPFYKIQCCETALDAKLSALKYIKENTNA